MKRTSPVRSIKGRLLLFSILLLALPWLGYQYLVEMRNFLIEGQEKAQLLMTRGIATLLQDRSDLFETDAAQLTSLDNENALYVFPLDYDPQLDGYFSDWEQLLQRSRRFGSESAVIHDTGITAPSAEMDIVMAVHAKHLYAAIRVYDEHTVYRHPAYRRLDNSDHLRISYVDTDNQLRRVLLTTEGPGLMSAYEMKRNWKYPLDGQPLVRLRAYLQENRDGYSIELRMPLALFGDDKRLRISAADVDDPRHRNLLAEIGTLPAEWSEELNRMILRSPQLERILTGLGNTDARIWVVDRHRRVRAATGREQPVDGGTRLTALTDSLDPALVDEALAGRISVKRSRHDVENIDVIVTAQPVYADNVIVGAVVLEKNTDDILLQQREVFFRISLATLLVLLVIISGLLLFSSRLAWRIRRLGSETSSAIDPYGRVNHTGIYAEQLARDELGVLSRNISDILQRLARYTRFLETLPRTLRHEINNPLNVISTSLQNLADGAEGEDLVRYLESAERGVLRLTHIMNSLTEAASLEDALHQDDAMPLDLAVLLRGYAAGCQQLDTRRRVDYTGPEQGVAIRGSEIRLEQMLDKLLDNAMDFARDDTAIEVCLEVGEKEAMIRIINRGPLLPESVLGSDFLSMTSVRETQDSKPHLGIGLYTVRLIAEHHDGRLLAENLADGSGVRFTVSLPLDTTARIKDSELRN